MPDSRELSIKITVNAGSSKAVVEALSKALGNIGTTTARAAQSTKRDLGETKKDTKQTTDGLTALLNKLKELAGDSPEAKAALAELQSTIRKFGNNSKEAAQALTSAVGAIERFNRTAAKVGVGDKGLLRSAILRDRMELEKFREEIKKVAQTARGAMGSGAAVGPFRQQLDAQVQATEAAYRRLASAKNLLTSLKADRAGGATIISKKEIREAEAEVRRLENALKSEKATLEQLAPSLVAAAAGHRQLENNVKRGLSVFASEYKAGADQQKQFEANVRRGVALFAGEYRAGLQAATAAERQRAAAVRESERATREAIKVAARYQQAVQQQIDTNRRNAYSFTIAGVQVSQFADSLMNSLSSAAQNFADFDWNMRRAALSMGIAADTSVNFDHLTKSIQNLSIETKLFDPAQVAEALYFWGSTTGVVIDSQEELQRTTSQVIPVMKAAAMAGVDLETALKGVYGITQQFDLAIEDTERVTNLLFNATMKTALEFGDLLNSFKMVGPVAAQLGVPLEDMVSLLGAIGDAGIRGSQSGRAFRQFFIRLSKDSALTTEMLDKAALATDGLGKTWSEVVFPNGKFIGMQGALDALSKMTMNMTQAQREQLLSSAATANEYPVLTELVNANTKSLRENGKGIIEVYNKNKGLTDSLNSIEKGWETMGNSARAVFTELNNKIQPLLLRFGKSLVDAFRPIAKAIGDAAMALNEFAKANPVLFDTVVAITAVTISLSVLAGTSLKAIGAFKLLTGTVLPEFIVMLASYDGRLKAATAANAAFNASMIGLRSNLRGATGIAKAGSEIKFLPDNKTMKATIANFIGVQNVVGSASSGFTKLAGSVSRLLGLFGLIVVSIDFLINFFKGFSIGMGVGADKTEKMSQSGKGLLDVFGEILKIIGKLPEMVNTGLQVLGAVFGALINLTVRLAKQSRFLGTVFEGLGIVFKFFGEAVNAVFNFLKGINDEIDRLIGTAKDGLVTSETQKAKDQKNLDDTRRMMAEHYRQVALDQKESNTQLATQQIEAEQQRLAEVIRQQEENAAAMRDAFERGIYVPATMVFEKLSNYTQEQGKMIPQAFASGILGSDPANMQALLDTSFSSVVSALSSPDSLTSKAGAQAGLNMITSFYTEGKEQVPPAVLALTSFVQEAMASESDTFRSLGSEAMSYLLSDMGNYGQRVAPQAIGQVMGSIGQMLNSTKPAIQQQGAELMASLTRGFAAMPGLSPLIASQLNAMVTLMSSGNVEAAKSGYNLMVSYLSGNMQGFDRNFASIKARIAALKALLGASGRRIDLFGERGEIQREILEAERLLNMATSLKAAGPLTVTPPKVTTPTTGAGSAGRQTSPLESALTVAQNAASLAEALKKIEGVDIKSLVKRTMGGIAEAMKLAVTITAKYARGVGQKTLQHVADFSEAVSAVAAAIGATTDAFAKATNFKRVPKTTLKSLIANVHEAVVLMARSAKNIKADAIASATVFAESIEKIVGGIASAFEVFSKLSTYVRPLPGVLEGIVETSIEAVRLMVRAMMSFGMSTEQMSAVNAFSEMVSAVVGAIGSTYDAFVKTIEFVDQFRETIDFQTVFGWIRFAVSEMKSIADGYTTETINKVAALGEAVSKIAEAINAFFNIGRNASQDPDTLGRLVAQALGTILETVANFVAAFYQTGADMIANFVAGMRSQEAALREQVATMEAILGGFATPVTISVTGDSPTLTINHIVRDPDGVLRNADTEAVAGILSGSQFISNLYSAANTQ